MMEDDLRTRAMAAGVAEFHWGEVPQDTVLPYALALTVSDPRPQHLKGYQGMRQTQVQIDCLARTRKAAAEMAETLVAALSDPGVVGSTRFGRGAAQGPIDRSADLGGKTIYRLILEFSVAWRDI
jgi:hypothetical protein